MKRKFFAGGILIVIAIAASVVFFFFGQKLEVSSASTVMEKQPYHVHFSKGIGENSIKEQKIYVTGENGEKVNAVITLEENQQSLVIENLKPGQYVLHVEENAFKQKSIQADKQKIKFNVIEKIEGISSVQELQDYFQTILDRESKNQNFEATTEESSDTSNTSSASDKALAESESSYSSTNNQVEEIDEGDTVVTDGKFIYSIIENQVIITDVRKPQLKVASKIKLDGNSYPMQLMIHNDMLIVFTDQYIETEKDGHISGISMTKAAFYNVKDAANPQLIREIGQDGYMNGLRKYEDTLYIVTNNTPNYWLLSEQEEVELRPYTYDSSEGEELEPMGIDKLTILPGSSEPNYTIISAINLANFKNEKVETKGFLGGSSALYMSKEALYLTAINYLPATVEGNATSKMAEDMAIMPVGAANTDIYKFSIDGTNVEFKASTAISGTILNQFSMDEHEGFFRVATTEGNLFGSSEEATKNHLFIYNENLEKVGEVTDLAKGEKIYSARFMGDKAYIVTFKQVDPLFVIDLQNPEQPEVLGELKIPGFSNYLHPLDENHLIGIGYDTENRVDNFSKEPFTTTAGIKISLFDITDYTNPKEQDSVIIGGRGTYSEVEYNHKALFRNDQHNYYGFPVSVYEGKGEYEVEYKGSGAHVYEITAENGIKLKGDLVKPAKEGEEYEDWESAILRLMYIDETLYTVSRENIKSYDLQTFNEINSVQFK
ncbi:beta-propeller domain-containing protein [Ureibacillus aquaedulcis]|uniref:Beta-propeller domain-containing protein n=1 Tax=Ureibacillus aquaedulcis TaxID=3058421 RepID=A0ABT8GTT1_9BACL|nr:beta-propeller domain-containing protein [Ureibacillus sp. BA0131]MDN4494814.1 beta-propeller domain-containing protein [Ureibacillus sp. BA0131]